MASDINHVVLIGRLTRDAELKYTNGGTAVTKFSLANNQSRKSGDQWTEEVHYFDVTLWGRSAEAVTKYLTKGKQVAVDGRLQQERWEKDGQKHSRVSITANNVELLGSGSGQGGGGGRGGPAERQDAPEGPEPSGGDKFEDDIPF